MDDDVTTRLPNDVTLMIATLAMGHRQMVISGLHGDITRQCITSGLLTDATIRTVTLAA